VRPAGTAKRKATRTAGEASDPVAMRVALGLGFLGRVSVDGFEGDAGRGREGRARPLNRPEVLRRDWLRGAKGVRAICLDRGPLRA